MAVFSRLQSVNTSCADYFHPYDPSCANTAINLTKDALQESVRIYVMAYLLGLVLRKKIPSKRDIRRTILGILQSTAFLTTNATGFSQFVCFIRWLFGSYNFLTAAFVPAFLASYVAINVERPSRRSLLCLYVTNVASETLFRMAVARKLIKPVKYGEILIFSISIAQLLYFFRGNHVSSDPIYGFLRFLVGPYEESGYEAPTRSTADNAPRLKKYSGKNVILASYVMLVNRSKELWAKIKSIPAHMTCPHPYSCQHYIISDGGRMFLLGYTFQLCLKLLLQQRRIFRDPSVVKKILLSLDTMRLGALFTSFSVIFRGVSCCLRRQTGRDDKRFAYPAGMLAGISFILFRDNTIALYFMWKTFNVIYNKAVEKGRLPDVPYSTEILYSLSTAVLFHSGILEPLSLRPSYWRFLKAISGSRLEMLDRSYLEGFGFDTMRQLNVVQNRETRHR